MTRIPRAAAAAAVLAVASPSAALAGTCAPGTGWGSVDRRAARDVVAQTNAHRLSLHLPQLAIDGSLTRAATWKSLHMARYAYFDHDDPAPPVRRSAFQRIRDCGFRAQVALGENIAAGYGTVGAVMLGWLHSQGHRENIERRAFRRIGVGVARRSGSQYGIYWTQDFAGATGHEGRPPVARPDAVSVASGRYVRAAVRRNDHDPDGSALRLAAVGTPLHGKAAMAVGGTVAYRSDAGFHGTDRVRVLVQDAQGMVARSTLTVRVR